MLSRRARLRWLAGFAALTVLVGWSAPRALRGYWEARSANPVRRGLRLAGELGCFTCHGAQGAGGVGDPTATGGEVPAWSGGTWMMYVGSDEQIRQYILEGVSQARRDSATATAERERATIRMPAYRDLVDAGEVEDLVAAFKIVSRMAVPDAGTPERRGLELAERWRCFACHNVAGAGGLANPGSLAGFIPGWYGADFEDLVRGREEFDAWVRAGAVDRLRRNRVAARFLRRQRVAMPAYRRFTDAELDDLWAYVGWLAATDGGHRGVERSW